MSIPLVIFHPMDPRGAKVGGAENFVRGLIRLAPPDFNVELIGVSATGPAGGEVTLTEGHTPFRFTPLFGIVEENRRTLVPLSLRYTLALWPGRHRFRNKVLFFNRIEPLLLFRDHPEPKIVAIHNDVQKQIASGPGEVLWSRFPRLYFAMEKKCLPSADLVLSVSRPMVDEYRRRYAALRDRIEWFPSWFDPDLFSPPEDRAAEKRKLAQRYPALRIHADWILFTGRFQPQKAPIRLIEAFDRVCQRRPDTTLLLIGDGNLKADMVRTVAKLGRQDRVAFLEPLPQPELAAFYRASDAFLLASEYEGMPMSVLEALACGLPVVSTPVGEVPAWVTPGSTGEIAADQSVSALATALDQLLSQRARYTAAACAHAVQAFTPHAVLQPLYDRMRSLANQRATGRMR